MVLYIFTLGFYGFYWHFKNWKQLKIAYDDHEPMPIMRSLFSIFFTHALFNVIDMRIKDKEIDFTWRPNFWATLAVISLIAERIISQLTADDTNVSIIGLLPFLLMLIYGYTLLQAQYAINASCSDPQGKSNSHFTLFNCIWIFLGSILLSLILIGLFLPTE